jgi:hypothetical protein
MAATPDKSPAGAETKKLGNGNGSTAMLKWIVGAAIGVVSFVILGGGAVFATSWMRGIEGAVSTHTATLASRGERISLSEARLEAMELDNGAALASIDKRLGNIERWQEDMRNTISELKAYTKSHP